MAIETAQILSSAAQLRGTYVEGLYKPGWLHHPCVKWTAESKYNFAWTAYLLRCILKEFEYRFGFTHKTEKILVVILGLPEFKEVIQETQAVSPENIHFNRLLAKISPPALAMPDFYKDIYKWAVNARKENGFGVDSEKEVLIEASIDAYQMYYVMEKLTQPWAVYKRGNTPYDLTRLQGEIEIWGKLKEENNQNQKPVTIPTTQSGLDRLSAQIEPEQNIIQSVEFVEPTQSTTSASAGILDIAQQVRIRRRNDPWLELD